MAGFLVPKSQFFDSNGDPLEDGLIYTYEVGTTDDKTTYTTSALSVAQSNPIVLNSRGEPDNPIWFSGTMKMVLKDSGDSTVYTFDTVRGVGAGSSGSTYFIGDYDDNLATAITAIDTSEVTLVIDKEITLAANATVPSNINLQFTRGGSFTGAFTLTVNGSIDAGPWQIFDSSITAAGSPDIKEAYSEWFGAVADGATSDTVAMQSAADFFPVVQFLDKQYAVDAAVDINEFNVLKGVGWPRAAGSSGTHILRTGNVIMFNIVGTVQGGETGATPHHRRVEFRDMLISGAGYTADVFYVKAVSFLRIDNCWITGGDTDNGRVINMQEVYDSVISRSHISECGSADGTLPGILLASDPGDSSIDTTNQIHFVHCDFESYNGVMIDTSGTNTNEIFFEGCKFESSRSNSSHMTFTSANIVSFSPSCTVTSTGTDSSTVDSVIDFTSCATLFLDLFMEHNAGASGTAVTLNKFISLTTCNQVFGRVTFGSGVDSTNLNNSYVCYQATSDVQTWDLSILLPTTNADSINALNTTMHRSASGFRLWRFGEPTLQFKNLSIDNTEIWDIGRVVADGAGSRFRILHNETVVGSFDNNGKLTLNLSDIATNNAGSGIIVTSPDGNETRRISIDNAGAISVLGV